MHEMHFSVQEMCISLVYTVHLYNNLRFIGHLSFGMLSDTLLYLLTTMKYVYCKISS
jgi:hypothetical protein